MLRVSVVVAAALLFGGGLAAIAGTRRAIPDANGLITACYSDHTGALRAIDASIASCRSDETALIWNQQGPPGPTGATGAPGPTGPSAPVGYELMTTSVTNDSAVLPGAIFEIEATCPSGKRPTGGGWQQMPVPSNGVEVSVQNSYPTVSGWHVRAFLRPARTMTVFAACISAP